MDEGAYLWGEEEEGCLSMTIASGVKTHYWCRLQTRKRVKLTLKKEKWGGEGGIRYLKSRSSRPERRRGKARFPFGIEEGNLVSMGVPYTAPVLAVLVDSGEGRHVLRGVFGLDGIHDDHHNIIHHDHVWWLRSLCWALYGSPFYHRRPLDRAVLRNGCFAANFSIIGGEGVGFLVMMNYEQYDHE